MNPRGRVVLQGRVERLPGEFAHWSYRDLADQLKSVSRSSAACRQPVVARGRRTRAAILSLRPAARFLRGLSAEAGLPGRRAGFVVAAATAFHVFLKYASSRRSSVRAPARSRPRARPRATP